MSKSFYDWFTTFIEEKGIELGEFFTNKKGVQLQIGDVVQAIINAPDHEQEKIKDIIVKIDFINGDVCHFFRHLGNALDMPTELNF